MPARPGFCVAAAAAMVLLAVAAVAAPSHAQPGPPSGVPAERGLGIRLLEAPAERVEDPRARSYVIDHVAPGSVIERDVEISNQTGVSARVDLYPGAARLDGGQFLVDDVGQANEVTSWTSVTPNTAVLSSGTTTRATLTIRVPSDAAAGEYYGVVWASMPPSGGAGTVAVTTRVGVRVYLSVGGSEPRTDYTIGAVKGDRSPDGQALLKVPVCNTGGRAVDLVADAALADGPGGTSVGAVTADAALTLGIRQCGAMTVRFDDAIADGPWQSHVTLRSGLTERRATATVIFAPATVDGAGMQRSLLAAVLAAVVVSLLALGVWARRRRARAGLRQPLTGVPVGRPPTDRGGHPVATASR